MSSRTSARICGALLGLLLVGGTAGAQAPTGRITGLVTDSASAQPLAGVHVTIGTGAGSITHEDGRYAISALAAGSYTVRVARVGYIAASRVVRLGEGETATADFVLAHSAVVLSDVVSVGYGEKTRANVTESIVSVNADQALKTATTTIEQGLQGRVAGVNVTTGDAAPGGGMRVQIRGVNSVNSGSNQPLYVIDGVPVASSDVSKSNFNSGVASALTETNPLSTLAPSDIESIAILKDASATAIYGSRGANGVVLITTKKSRAQQGGMLSLDVSQGWTSVTKQIRVLTAPEYARYTNLSWAQGYGTPASGLPYGGRPGSWSPERIQAAIGNGVNWEDEIFRTAPIQNATLAASGRDPNGSYMVSGNLLNEQGVINGSSFRRGGIRANLDRALNDRFRFQSNMTLTRSINDMVRTSTIGATAWRDLGIVRQALAYVPMRHLNGDTTTVAGDSRAVDAETWAAFGADPRRYTDEVNENDATTRGLGNFKVTTQLPWNFALDLNVGGNYERRGYGSYYPRTVQEGYSANGIAIAAGSEFYNILNDDLLRWNRSFGVQHIDALGGFSYENSRSSWQSNTVSGFANDYLGNNVLQLASKVSTPYSGVGAWKLASFLGRVNYSLLDRYLLTGTVRQDGSSKFAANNKWATFYSGAFAWRMLQEPFFRRGNTFGFNDVKLRVSAGQSGNQAIGAYQSLGALEGGTFPINEVMVPIFYVARLANPNLKWETTTQYDAGLDVTAWDSRLNATVDVYRKITNDLLQNITVAPNTGFSRATINSGSVTNRGIELSTDVTPVQLANSFTWTVGANASRNINRLESLGPTARQFAGEIPTAGGGPAVVPFIQQPGLALGSIWGYVVQGIQKTVPTHADTLRDPSISYGSYVYKDINGDGKIDSNDQTLIGYGFPKWTYGFNNAVSWRGLDASALVTGVVGGSVINVERFRYLQMNMRQNVPKYYIDRAWNPTTNPNGKFQRIDNGRVKMRFNDQILESGTYMRLKNIQVGYKLPWAQLNGTRVYFNAVNPLTFTHYTGFDPEVSAYASAATPNVDQGNYPNAKIYTIGASTNF